MTEFERVRETAELALAGRDVPLLVVPELNDPRYGEFEGGSLDGVPRLGRAARPPLDAPAGGEQPRASVAAATPAASGSLLDRPEDTILVVAHSLPLRVPVATRLAGTAAAEPDGHGRLRAGAVRLDARASSSGRVGVLEAWAASPAF